MIHPIDEKPAPQHSTRNDVTGDPGAVVQSGAVDTVNVGGTHDRRGLRAMALVAALLVVALVVVILFDRRVDGEPGGASSGAAPPLGEQPVGAVATQSAVACRSGWVLDGHGGAPIPHSQSDLPDGAIVSSGGEVTVTVQGLLRKSVVLQDMRVEVVDRAPIANGLYLPKGCQDGLGPRLYLLDLDAAEPALVAEAATVRFPYRVDEVEPEQFVITTAVGTGVVDWRLVLDWTSGDESGELTIDDSGKPFRTAASAGLRALCPDMENHVWVWRLSC
ncbi:hypothetical protein [Saccharothrix deserti]|uniref:hypothetical protein n=1 Tax=Saccharothrix deserti TaxID=2593674 RepID=UPI00131B3A7F|nr:hypothetical protein [Saccharothrix deserti]